MTCGHRFRGRAACFESNGRLRSRGWRPPTTFDSSGCVEVRDARTRANEWVGFAKGGAFSPFYSDVDLLCVDWDDDARAEGVSWSLTEALALVANWTAELHGSEHYFRPGLTWPRRTKAGFRIRVMPAGCIFGDKGPAAFVDGDDPKRASGSARCHSRARVSATWSALADGAGGSYEVGRHSANALAEPLERRCEVRLARLARRALVAEALARHHQRDLPRVRPASAGLNDEVTGLDRGAVERELDSIQRQIDEVCVRLYGIGPEDRAAIEASVEASVLLERRGRRGQRRG